MQVFVTGATGFIGGAVTERLIAHGHQVVGLSRSEGAAERLRTMGAIPHTGDLSDHASLRAAAQAADAVVHAAFGHDDWSRMDLSFQQDAAAVHAMLDVLAGTNKPLIYTSGSGVLGDTGPHAVDETMPGSRAGDVGLRTHLEETVIEAGKRNIGGFVLRPGLVYGRSGGGVMHMLIDLARRSGAATTVGSGGNVWSAVHIDDLVGAYLLALVSPQNGLFNVADNNVFTMRDIAAAIGRMLGYAGEVAQWPLEEARSAIGMLADGLASNKRISAAKAHAVLGWSAAAPSIIAEIETGSYASLRDAANAEH